MSATTFSDDRRWLFLHHKIMRETVEETRIANEKEPLPTDWMQNLGAEFEKDYMRSLKSFLDEQIVAGKVIYPHASEIYQAFHVTPFKNVKAVIIGQDPYHGPGQAHGMCFSVKPGIQVPPSLRNIYKELQSDLAIPHPGHGHLIEWAKEGVLLLNSSLTVEKSKAGSHQKKGWEIFTNKVIEVLNEEKQNLVFFLWGNPAQKKAKNVDDKKHLVLKSVHPSPLSAHRGFFGQNHFSKANQYLKENGVGEIDWSLTPIQ